MERLECNHDAASAEGPTVGLIVLQSDEVLEHELAAWLPARLRRLHTRIPNSTDVTADTLRAMEHDLPGAARLLPTNVRFDVVAYGCTSASTLIGERRVAELIASVIPDAAITDPLSAAKARLRDLGAERIALLTPYTPDISHALVEQLASSGIDVRHVATFDEHDDSRVARIAERSVLEAMIALGERGDCEAVFASCTNLRALGILDEAQRRSGVPVLTSNSALAWHIERLAEPDGVLQGPDLIR